jgi:hypothetical protein
LLKGRRTNKRNITWKNKGRRIAVATDCYRLQIAHNDLNRKNSASLEDKNYDEVNDYWLIMVVFELIEDIPSLTFCSNLLACEGFNKRGIELFFHPLLHNFRIKDKFSAIKAWWVSICSVG